MDQDPRVQAAPLCVAAAGLTEANIPAECTTGPCLTLLWLTNPVCLRYVDCTPKVSIQLENQAAQSTSHVTAPRFFHGVSKPFGPRCAVLAAAWGLKPITASGTICDVLSTG